MKAAAAAKGAAFGKAVEAAARAPHSYFKAVAGSAATAIGPYKRRWPKSD